MTQQNDTMYFYIQDAGGQVIKVKQTTSTNLQLAALPALEPTVIAAYKSPSQDANQETTVLTSAPQVIKATLVLQASKAKGQHVPQVVSLPIQSPSRVNVSLPEPTPLPRTILLASYPVTQCVLPFNPPKNYNYPILDYSGSRKQQEMESDFIPKYEQRKTKSLSFGYFSMKVCETVQKKGTISFNELTKELVAEFINPSLMASPTDEYDMKNIRRRMYNALNVLVAMNIISKEKRVIRWLGLPTNSLQECINLEKDKQCRVERIKLKTQQLQELILKQIALKNLIERNRAMESKYGPPPPKSVIQLPFITVNTSKKTVINYSIANDKMEYLFNFDDKCEVNDDIEVLKRMGMVLGLHKGECSESDLQKAKSMVPESLENYVILMATGQTNVLLPEVCVDPSSSLSVEDLGVGELSSQSSHASSDPMSPLINDFSDNKSDISSEPKVN